jgi:hypothetical protein
LFRLEKEFVLTLDLIRAYYYDSSDNPISYQDAASGLAGSLRTAWEYTGGRITTPANAAKMRIQLYDYMNSGWVAYDDVELYKIVNGNRSGGNLAPNPGFESSSNWSENGFSAYPGTSFHRNTWGTGAPHSGSYAYAISNHAYGYLQTDMITILPSTEYDLYAYVRGELDAEDSEGGGWLIRAYYYDSGDNYISYQNSATGAAGSLNTTWQYLGGRITTPANAAKMRIQLFEYMSSGWVAYDDIYLRKVGNYTQVYDAENRLVSVTGGVTASFYYDGDGNRVKGTIGGVTTTYKGTPSVPSGQGYFEWTGSTSTMKRYYYAGATRVAMRTGASTLNYLLGDHLGSQAITANSSGVTHSLRSVQAHSLCSVQVSAEVRYMPWGTERYTYGTMPTGSAGVDGASGTHPTAEDVPHSTFVSLESVMLFFPYLSSFNPRATFTASTTHTTPAAPPVIVAQRRHRKCCTTHREQQGRTHLEEYLPDETQALCPSGGCIGDHLS